MSQPTFVLGEAYTLIRRRVGPQAVIRFGREIQQAIDLRATRLVRILAKMERDAWNLFEQYNDIVKLVTAGFTQQRLKGWKSPQSPHGH